MCGEPDCGAMRGASVIVQRAGAAIGRAADDGEEHSERYQSESGNYNDQEALRWAGHHAGGVLLHPGVRPSGTGDPIDKRSVFTSCKGDSKWA